MSPDDALICVLSIYVILWAAYKLYCNGDDDE